MSPAVSLRVGLPSGSSKMAEQDDRAAEDHVIGDLGEL
jgi:hypothetical protein